MSAFFLAKMSRPQEMGIRGKLDKGYFCVNLASGI
jgi:hypothetical protein